jgi:DNA polymerase-3 subunit delta
VERLALFGEKEYDLPALTAALGDHARFEIFALADALLAGDRVRSLRILGALRREGIESILVGFILTRTVREAALLAARVAQGQPLGEVLQGVYAKRRPAMQAVLGRMPLHRLHQTLRLAALLDAVVKGTACGDPWGILTWMCLSLTVPRFPLARLLHTLENCRRADLLRMAPLAGSA